MLVSGDTVTLWAGVTVCICLSSHIEEKQVEIQKIKKEYEREISELK